MKNVTKLSCWKDLEKLGFEPINYNAFGRKVCIGASLRRKLTDISGKEFHADIITIEPHDFRYSKKCYHITGNWINAVPVRFAGTDNWYSETRCNEHFTAKEILAIVLKLKTA